jgi:VIT1/CCC1 family predicted Fe2+/Mn2+ transporter
MTDTIASSRDIGRWRANLQAEVDGELVYRAMAANAGDERLVPLYREMADAEARHAELWRGRLRGAGAADRVGPSWRARTLAMLARRLGAGLVAPTVAKQEREGRTMYDDQPEAAGTSLAADERSHARLLHRITGGASGAMLARFDGRHRAVDGNALRAAVLGANDGLVSNLSLVMGVAGASLSSESILVTGLAGLLAGSASMALGEWLSVQSSRELFANQLAIEAAELEEIPEEEEAELALIYQAKGLAKAQAEEVAHRVMGTRESALDTLAREELGMDPEALGGSAWEAAFTSFVLFAIGAIIPVAPFIWTEGATAVAASLGLSTIGLFAIGAGITLLTGRSLWVSGTRQVVFGLGAAALTFGVGRLIGAAII